MPFDRDRQAGLASRFLALHDDPRLLVLCNVWDPMGALMVQSLGFPAVATASAAIAYSLGYDDGERITFDVMLDTIARIANAVDVPVSADIERGYAGSLDGLDGNIRDVIHAGAVGVNIEDSIVEGESLRSLDEQVARIRAVRAAADDESVPLVINARVDTYVGGFEGTPEALFEETATRARAYLGAGADCIYPLLLDDLDTLVRLREATGARLNVYAQKGTPPMRDLEAAGIARLSIGAGMLRASYTAAKAVAENLKEYGSYDGFADAESPGGIVSKEPMKPLPSD